MTTHMQSDSIVSERDAAQPLPGRPSPWSSRQWCQYFETNAQHLLDIPWQAGAGITPGERAAIADSLREFQLGESAEGRHFVHGARQYADRTGDHEYVVAVRQLIAEEQRHARDLGRFLQLADVPLARRTCSDTIFRWLRKRAGLELSVSVLVTAEIIAQVYYVALAEATRSALLRQICAQIMRDELEHVRFQAERLAILRGRRSRWLLGAAHTAHRALFASACLVVWAKHGRALRAGGFGFRRFWGSAWRAYGAARRQMDPRGYAVLER